MHKLITDNLNTWSSAIKLKSTTGRGSASKQELYGIKKLRELILELAVRGLLVPQNAGDEPASLLLEKINKEKEKLVKEKIIKKPKKLPEVEEQEKSFELPRGWAWVRLGFLLDRISNGFSGKQNKDGVGLPVTRIETISLSEVNPKKLGYTELIPEDKRQYYKLIKGDILLSHINSDYHVAKTAVFKGGYDLYHGVNLLLLRPNKLVAYQYIDLVINHLRLTGYYISVAQHAIGQSSINQSKVNETLVSLPPLQEQKRIVAKVDELMALCDQLEQQQENSISAHQTLVETLLGALSNAADKGEFDKAWQRIAQHFDTLFTTEHSIDQLKQTILQLAVMGKLVPQDPSDEPASKSFDEFYSYKNELAERKIIKFKKRKKDIDFDTSNFPQSWELFKWNDISHWITYGFTRPMPHYDSGIPIATGKNVNYSKIDLVNAHFTDEESFNNLSQKDKPIDGDILITKDGSIGRTAIVDRHGIFCINQSVAVMWLKKLPASRRFLKLVIDSPLSQKHIQEHSKGQAIKHLSITDFGNMTCPMPPIPEQDRIVQKVDELMALCDQLKTQIQHAQTTQNHLADAMAEQALV